MSEPAPRRTRRGGLLSVAAIVAVGMLLAVLAFAPLGGGESGPARGPLIGTRAPALAGTDLDGRRWTLDEAAAEGRLVWVNFWSTSCVPCRTEMPAMQALAEAHSDDLLVLGVDFGEQREAVVDFVDRYAIAYPILLDPTLENYYRWSARDGLPRHYFVRDGVVVAEVVGELAPADMLTLLDDLLG